MTNYGDILSQIYSDSNFSEKAVEVNDKQLIVSINRQKEECDPQYDERNEIYTKLLKEYFESYKSKTSWKKWYKLIFFVIVIAAFGVIIGFGLISINNVSIKQQSTSLADLGVVIGSFSGILSSLLIVPKIIAEHLFPNNEDTNMIEMIKNMQQNDSGIRNWLHPSEKEAEKTI